jgi:hypothetical protein
MPKVEVPQTIAVTDRAFHGTSLANAQKILAEGWIQSVGDKQMLGDGVYFFDGSHSEALIWAKLRHKPPWAVLQAKIQHGRCLDLIEIQHQDMVREVANRLTGRGIRDVTDALAINALAKIAKIDTVRAVRRKRSARPFRPGSPLETGFQIILCVRTLSKIHNTELAVTITT